MVLLFCSHRCSQTIRGLTIRLLAMLAILLTVIGLRPISTRLSTVCSLTAATIWILKGFLEDVTLKMSCALLISTRLAAKCYVWRGTCSTPL